MYTLKCQGATASVKTKGAELASYVAANGKEYLWHGDPQAWPGHSPVLFPVVGTTIDGVVRIGGVPYNIPKHGHPRHEDFRLGLQGEDFVEFIYEPGDTSFQKYPFDFALRVVHTIRPDGFTTQFIVENRSDRAMPFFIGGHPGFACPLEKGELFEDYVVRFECVEDGRNTLAPGGGCITGTEYLPGFCNSDTLRLDYGLFEKRDALIFDGLKSRKVWLLHEKTGKGIEFRFPKFDLLAVWSAPGKRAPFLCLEPWSGLPAFENETGNIEDKPYVRYLQPGKSYQTSYSMRVVD